MEKRQVQKLEGEAFAEKHNIKLFLETSAQSGQNIEESFINTAKGVSLNSKEFFSFLNKK